MSPKETLHRRALLSSVAVVALAGCLGDGGGGDDGGPEPVDVPDVTFAIEGNNSGVTIRHESGESFDGELVELQGSATSPATPGTLADIVDGTWSEGTEGEIAAFNIGLGTLELVWVGTSEEEILAEFEVEQPG